ncbi:MAG: hypothetical protein CMJ18_01800 [Phycisphaeraceae bacterium]|nr:hypothetical protein [Phycisphaeraceae bacterium]
MHFVATQDLDVARVAVLWQIVLLLLACLAGAILVMIVRVLFRLRWRQVGKIESDRRRRRKAGEPDPWRVAGERLVTPMPRHEDDSEENDAD